MAKNRPFVHPYIPNSVPEVKKRMMEEMGIKDVEELFRDLPVRSKPPKLPGPMSEYDLRKHILGILAKNRDDLLIFCGSGCWPHYVPAVVDEIINRTEFKTAYLGEPESEKGKMQALFEFQSLVAELIEMDVVINSVYSEPASAGEAANMARRLTGRSEILVPRNMNYEKLQVMKSYTEWSGGRINQITYQPQNGKLDTNDLKKKISSKTAAVFIDNPSYFGILEDQVDQIAEITHDHGAIFIVSVDPSSLGVMRAPGDYQADIVVGSGQPLGLHMNYGGNSLGFFGCRSDEKYLDQLPGYVAAVTTTMDGKDKAYLDTLWEKRHFFFQRENATSMIGSSSNLCAIGAAVYLSLLGPQGMREIGEGVFQRTDYAIQQISKIKKVKTPVFEAPHFKEFIINFDKTERTVKEINKILLNKHGIVGGKDLSQDFPGLGQSALFCVTEVHGSGEIDKLADAIRQL
ncbi:MAG TPA: aminomethyl-transferring glycine dehydrogenase subunit GcvPA [Thermodesulfobacteriota bacterium]|nr:aminomethyl-transferring glycine dehydrogenase subunit GcvPA [Thermodesulfobacteriota bacterium]